MTVRASQPGAPCGSDEHYCLATAEFAGLHVRTRCWSIDDVAVDDRSELLALFRGKDARDLLIERSGEHAFFGGSHRNGLCSFEDLVLVSVVSQELVEPIRCLDQPLDALSRSRHTGSIEPLDHLSLDVGEPD